MASSPDARFRAHPPRRIVFDGLNLGLAQGTGIATYGRVLTRIAHNLGYDVGVVYSTPFTPASDPLLREIVFFDEKRAPNLLGVRLTPRRLLHSLMDQVRCYFPIEPLPVEFTGAVIADQFSETLPHQDFALVGRNLFKNARAFYNRTGKFVQLRLEPGADIFHCTYPLPLSALSACNICTIHDLVPLRLPFTTMETKRRTVQILRKIAHQADHIVTVSETSKRDIVELLGVNPDKITNTYQAVDFPKPYLTRPETAIASYLEALGLGLHAYLLFFGAMEPKKNVGRLVEAYFNSGVKIPLVLVTSSGWLNTAERKLIEQHERSRSHRSDRLGPGVRCLEYVGLSAMVTLLRGARAVVFPSLYEGFGLPVLEAMTLGTPVVTSSGGALPEIAGDAAVLVNPYDVDDIARGITEIVEDADLRSEFSKRGRARASEFSLDKYQARVQAVYARIG